MAPSNSSKKGGAAANKGCTPAASACSNRRLVGADADRLLRSSRRIVGSAARRSAAKGALFAFDALLASLTAVILLSIIITVVSSAYERSVNSLSSEQAELQRIQLADRLVKAGLAEEKQFGLLSQHELDEAKITPQLVSDAKQKLGVKKLRVNDVGDSDANECIRRIVFENGAPGVLYVCT